MNKITNKNNQYDKTIHWIRHGESLSNISDSNSNIIDPGLTTNGLDQCEKLKSYVNKNSQIFGSIDLIIVSPLTRTLETYHNVFGSNTNNSNIPVISVIPVIPVISLDMVREQMDKPCHKRKTISKLKLKKQFDQIDFSNLPHDDIMYEKVKGTETKSQVINRCNQFVQWLRARKEKNIIVVTHGNFLYPMFNDVLDLNPNLKISKSFFSNCELRTCKLV